MVVRTFRLEEGNYSFLRLALVDIRAEALHDSDQGPSAYRLNNNVSFFYDGIEEVVLSHRFDSEIYISASQLRESGNVKLIETTSPPDTSEDLEERIQKLRIKDGYKPPRRPKYRGGE